MLGSRIQTLQCVLHRNGVAVFVVSALVLGTSIFNWLPNQGPQSPAGVSAVCAAETPPANGSPAAAKDEPSDQPRAAKPAESPKDESPAIEYYPRPTKYEARIIEALDKPTSIEFLDLPLVDCMSYLTQYHKINIWIDRQALNDDGVALNQPITLKLAGVTFRSILKLLLEPVQLTYVIEDNVLKITTVAGAGSKLVARTYPVRDLYRGPLEAEGKPAEDKGAPRSSPSEVRRGDLETAIITAVEPESWGNKKGPGSMAYVREAGSLVIRQTALVHEQILQLLRDLRDAKRAGQGAAKETAAPRAGWKLLGPKRAETYSIIGFIDVDGDGHSDAGRLHDLINMIGANIDNEVDEQGELRVDGRIPDNGQPRMTAKTEFVVLGKIPQPADLSDADEIQASLKIAEHHKELEDQARALGVRIIKLEDFLAYIGYERLESKNE